jgi:hypothetical protein
MFGFENYDDLKDAHFKWVESETQTGNGDNLDSENTFLWIQ